MRRPIQTRLASLSRVSLVLGTVGLFVGCEAKPEPVVADASNPTGESAETKARREATEKFMKEQANSKKKR